LVFGFLGLLAAEQGSARELCGNAMLARYQSKSKAGKKIPA
jgi:hypothetical protein